MRGRFLQAGDVAGLRAEAVRAEADGAVAVLVTEGPLGDPVILAAGLSSSVQHALVGIRVVLSADGRHPAVLARDVTALDLVCRGRSAICFAPPFGDDLPEAISLCRALWHHGRATTDGPAYPVQRAVNRPRPGGEESPLVALDLTGGIALPSSLDGVADLLLLPTADRAVCRIERVQSAESS